MIKISKRFLSFLVALAMIVPMLPVMHFHAHAATTQDYSGSTVTNLGMSATPATGSGNQEGPVCSWTANGTGITGSLRGAKGKGSGVLWNGYYYASETTLTLTNNYSKDAKLSFTYDVTIANGGTAVVNGTTHKSAVTGQTVDVTLASKASITIKLTATQKSAIFSHPNPNGASITISNLQLIEDNSVTVNFGTATNGSYTVAKADGTAVDTSKPLSAQAVDSFVLTATPDSGYAFAGWYFTPEGGTEAFWAGSATFTNAMFQQSGTVVPKFIATTSGTWGVGNAVFSDLNNAITAANSSSSDKTIVPLKDVTLTGTYTIPKGVTLLVPFDAANTVYGADPEILSDNTGEGISYPTIKVYRTLTMASDAKLIVNGSIEIGAKHYASHGGKFVGGRPYEYYGKIVMNDSSEIQLNSGGTLYAWGYIIGSGKVTALSGSSVYEKMQVTDYLGGTGAALVTLYKIFPFSQYYVQNVEVEEVIHAGASLVVHAGVYADGINKAVLAFIGGSDAMFNLSSGSVTKLYEASSDRIIIDIDGTVSLSSITFPFGGKDYKSSEYILPIGHNYTINVNSNSATIAQQVMLQPGTEINVAQGATINVQSSVYVMDAYKWGNYCFGAQMRPVQYVASRNGAPVTRTLSDAKINVNGTVVVGTSGAIYTSEGNAQVISTGKTGMIQIDKKNSSNANIYRSTYAGGTYNPSTVSITMFPAVLTNGNSSRPTTGTSEAAVGTTYYYNTDCDMWVTHGASGHGYDNDCDADCNVCGATRTPDLHQYSDEVTAPTCTEKGYTTHTCTVCGHNYTSNETPATGHSLVQIGAKEPTCTEDGHNAYEYCKNCNHTTYEKIDKTGHSPADTHKTENKVEPSCETEGSYDKVFYCTVCNEKTSVETVTTSALGHTEVIDAAVAPTCTETGLTEGKHCSVCHKVLVAQETVAATGHTSGANATCTTAQTCTVCGATLNAATGHSYEAVVTAPTCTEKGYTTYTCSVCGDTYTADEVAATGHNYRTEWEFDSIKHWHECACEDKSEVGEHNYTDKFDVDCDTCGYERADATPVVAMIGDTKYASLPEAVAAAKDGETIVLCANVDLTEKLTVETKQTWAFGECIVTTRAVEGNYDIVVKGDLTIESGKFVISGWYGIGVTGKLTVNGGEFSVDGSNDYLIGSWGTTTITGGKFVGDYCNVNGFAGTLAISGGEFKVTNTGIEYPASDVFAEDSVATITGGTFSTDVTYYCANGHHTVDPDKDGVYTYGGHSYDAVVTDPTCTEKGYTTHTCACGDSYVDNYVDATGHDKISHEAKAPTCTEIGWDAYETCSRCNYTTYAEKAALGHNYNDEWACSICGADQPSDIWWDVSAAQDGSIIAYLHSMNEEQDAYGLVISGQGEMKNWSSAGDVPWKDYRIQIRKAIIRGGVTNIGSYTFGYCNSLTNIKISDGVTEIVAWAFYGCQSLINITLPASLKAIGYEAFRHCSSLTSIVIPDSVTVLGASSFEDCTALESVSIGNGVTKIDSYTFACCYSLVNMTLGTGVMCIDTYAFGSDGSSLQNIYITDIAAWCQIDFGTRALFKTDGSFNLYLNNDLVVDLVIPEGVAYISSYAFFNCTSLTSISLPDSVTSIGYFSFYNCALLKDINIPDAVAKIGGSAFHNCISLTNVVVPNGITSIEYNTFKNCSSLVSINIPNTVKNIDYGAFNNCISLKSITLPNGITTIGHSAFYNCTSLSSINIPDSVTNIGYPTGLVFYNCSSLTSIAIPNGVTYIGDSMFSGCTSLTDVTLGEGITTIAHSAFSNCTSLEYINIPEGVTTIYDSTFYNCSSLIGIYLPSTVTTISNYAFENCTSLTNVNIPEGVTDIGKGAFYACSSLKNLIIPDSVTNIGQEAFYACGALENVVIGDGVTSMKYVFSFYDNKNLKSVVLGNGVTAVEARMFANCSALTNVEIGSAVTWIGNYAFSNCTSLENIVIPANVTTIYDGAFERCYALTNITIPNSVTTIGMSAFEACRNLKSIIIPKDVTSIGYSAFLNCTGLSSVYIQSPTIAAQVTSNTACGYLCYYAKTVAIAQDITEVGSYITDNFTCVEDITYDGVAYTAYNHEHTPGEVVVENNVDATCTVDGSYDHVVYCSACGKELSRTTITVNATGHDEIHHKAKAPTCTEIGWDAYVTCSRCNYTTYAEKAALGHTEVTDAAVAPTCTETGLTEGKHCSVCGEVFVAQTVVDALGHDYEGVVTTNPTCTEKGVKTFTCKNDASHTYTEEVAATGHTEGEVIVENNVAADCENAGSYDNVTYCTVCGEELSRETVTVDATGHSYEAVVTAPTCTEKGYTTYTCSVCGDTYTADEVAALGHSHNAVVTAPTCTEAGYTTYTCACGESYVDDYENALGHDMTGGDNKAPTCTEAGYKINECTRCDHEEKTEVPATGHNWVDATCSTPKTCTNCGLTEGDVKNHNWGEIVVVTPPTCTEGGVNKVSCPDCGATSHLPVAALGHTHGSYAYNDDQHWSVCSVCNAAYGCEQHETETSCVCGDKLTVHDHNESQIEHTVHQGTDQDTVTVKHNNACVVVYRDAEGEYHTLTATQNNDGSYTYEMPKDAAEIIVAVKGDYTGDGLVTDEDVTKLQEAVLGKASYNETLLLVYDVNGDGKITGVDLALINAAQLKKTTLTWNTGQNGN